MFVCDLNNNDLIKEPYNTQKSVWRHDWIKVNTNGSWMQHLKEGSIALVINDQQREFFKAVCSSVTAQLTLFPKLMATEEPLVQVNAQDSL